MFVVDSYPLAVALCVVTMLCWGSWANTQKLAGTRWRFELFYWDYVLGVLIASIAFAITLGSTGTQGRSFLADLQQAAPVNLGWAVLGGIIFNAANILLVAAIALADGTIDAICSDHTPVDDNEKLLPFAEATLSANQPPAGTGKPVDKTLAGKNTPALLDQVQKIWKDIPLLGADGKVLAPRVVLETDQGEIEITLEPTAAPNHARNFLALVQTGFYDGLRFERVRKEEVVGEPELNVFSLEAGCPLGTGETGGGDLGYWLRSEAGNTLKMEKGVVGACLGEGPDSASCRFFILLDQAPSLQEKNTGFGRVTKGLEVAQAIAKKSLEDNPDGVEPVAIKKARVVAE